MHLQIKSSATLPLSHRRDLGTAKHIDVQFLWLQEAQREGRVSISKVHTDHNPADLLTKAATEHKMLHHMAILNFRYLD